MGSRLVCCTGPISSTGSPITLSTRPSVPSPTGTEMGPPVSVAFIPRTMPSVGSMLTQRTLDFVKKLHAEPGMMDHREPEDHDLAVQFAVRHDIELLPGSAFARWAGGTKAKVNSLHAQGIRRLGNRLVPEAFAPDGLVEGVRVDGSPSFAYGVQWHPEWQHETNPFYQRTLDAFAHACTDRRKRREEAQ